MRPWQPCHGPLQCVMLPVDLAVLSTPTSCCTQPWQSCYGPLQCVMLRVDLAVLLIPTISTPSGSAGSINS